MVTEDSADETTGSADQAAEPAVEMTEEELRREKYIRKFEKCFRLMDASERGDAENAFRQAKSLLDKIDLSFNTLMDMVNASAGGDRVEELEELLRQYASANQQYQASEEVLLRENERLNLLLRSVPSATLHARPTDVDIAASVKKITSTIAACDEFFAKLSVPQDQTLLAESYRAAVAAALLADRNHFSNKFFDKIALAVVDMISDRNPSLKEILKLQDTLVAQDKEIESNAKETLEQIGHLRAAVEILRDQVGILAGDLAARDVYEKAMEHLRQVQLDYAEVERARKFNAQMAELEERLALSDAGSAPLAKGADDSAVLASAHIDLEAAFRAQAKEMTVLRKRLAENQLAKVLTSEDMRLMRMASTMPAAIDIVVANLTKAVMIEENSASAPPRKNLEGFWGFMERMLEKVFFWKRPKTPIKASVDEVRQLTDKLGKISGDIAKVTDKFDRVAKKITQDAVNEIAAQSIWAQDQLDKTTTPRI